MNVDLSDRIAVVTGAGGVLAGLFSIRLAQAGARVALLDLNREAAEQNARLIRDGGGEAVAMECNVLDRASVEAAEAKVVDAFGGYNFLLNGAGGTNTRVNTTSDHFEPADVDDPEKISFFDMNDALFRSTVDLNLMGTFIPTQVFARGLVKAGSAGILNISSMASYVGLTRVCAYSAAKAGINVLTTWLATHFGPARLRVNAIAPGFFVTNQNRTMMTNPDGSYTERSRRVIAHTPLGRMGEPEDLVGIVLFLCDETASGFINGAIIPVDGGFMAVSGV